MPEVTSIEPQKKKPDRFNIFVDGKFAFGLDVEALVKSGLKIGQEISGKEIKKLVLENETNKLTERALRFLSFRPRSEREIRDHLKRKLSKKTIDATDTIDTVDTTIEKLKRLDYIDDLKFSQWWVEQRQTHNPRGARLIRSELFQKGVSKEIIDQVLPEDEESEVGRALQTAKKKLRSYKKLKPQEFKQKMSQYLARRGFDWEIIKETLVRLVDTSSQKE